MRHFCFICTAKDLPVFDAYVSKYLPDDALPSRYFKTHDVSLQDLEPILVTIEGAKWTYIKNHQTDAWDEELEDNVLVPTDVIYNPQDYPELLI